jgi:hypothetical protein
MPITLSTELIPGKRIAQFGMQCLAEGFDIGGSDYARLVALGVADIGIAKSVARSRVDIVRALLDALATSRAK